MDMVELLKDNMEAERGRLTPTEGISGSACYSVIVYLQQLYATNIQKSLKNHGYNRQY